MAARELVNGVVAVALGVLAVTLAVIEYVVFVETAGPVADDSAAGVFDVSFGTGAYILCYSAAGTILLVLGICRIYRSMRGTRARRAPRA